MLNAKPTHFIYMHVILFSASRNCVQILAWWSWALLCCNMRKWQWLNCTTKGLRILSSQGTVSLCIKIAINNLHLCSMFVSCVCPYHRHAVHNNIHIIRKPNAHALPYTLSVICPIQCQAGSFIHEYSSSFKCQMPSKVNICLLSSVTMMNCSQIKIMVRETSMQMNFPKLVCAKLLEIILEEPCGREMNIQLMGNSSGHSCSQCHDMW